LTLKASRRIVVTLFARRGVDDPVPADCNGAIVVACGRLPFVVACFAGTGVDAPVSTRSKGAVKVAGGGLAGVVTGLGAITTSCVGAVVVAGCLTTGAVTFFPGCNVGHPIAAGWKRAVDVTGRGFAAFIALLSLLDDAVPTGCQCAAGEAAIGIVVVAIVTGFLRSDETVPADLLRTIRFAGRSFSVRGAQVALLAGVELAVPANRIRARLAPRARLIGSRAVRGCTGFTGGVRCLHSRCLHSRS